VKSILLLTVVLAAASTAATAQPAEKIAVTLDARTEGSPARDAAAARLLADVRRGLEAFTDVDVVPAEHARRTIWMITGAATAPLAVSVIVTERYDRETLMVLGIEDDDMAGRMMALQIVADHQIFTGRDPAAVAKRIVTAINDGIFARLRTIRPRP
jgi:hypothetical protein